MKSVSRPLALLALLLCSFGVSAYGGSQTSVASAYVIAGLNAGDSFSIACERRFETSGGSVYVAWARDLPDGTTQAGASRIAASNDFYIETNEQTGVLPSRVIAEQAVASFSDPFSHSETAQRNGEVLRVAWAAWGGPTISCQVEVRGQQLASRPLDPGAAIFVSAAGTENGPAIATSLGGAAVHSEFRRQAHGYFFASLFGASPTDGIWIGTVEGPGVNRTVVNQSVFLAEPGNAQWTFSFTAAIDLLYGARWLWILDLPE